MADFVRACSLDDVKDGSAIRVVIDGMPVAIVRSARLPASAPMMWTPNTRSVFASASTLAKPSVAAMVLARALAVNGNFPIL